MIFITNTLISCFLTVSFFMKNVKFPNLTTLISKTFKFNELKNKNLSVYTHYHLKKKSILWAVSSVGRE